MTLNKDLQVIGKELTKLVNQIEKLAAALGKGEKPKAKSVKTAPKSKAVSKRTPTKGGKTTDTDKVLAIINRSKKGVDTATLMKKTGFPEKSPQHAEQDIQAGKNHKSCKRNLCRCEVKMDQGRDDSDGLKNRSIIDDPNQSPYCRGGCQTKRLSKEPIFRNGRNPAGNH